ncbi:MAG: hypothetical protein PHI98_01165 [Eubacteriales bacterium]|nr:hypothetical protein [Eubacteriales bacterium]
MPAQSISLQRISRPAAIPEPEKTMEEETPSLEQKEQTGKEEPSLEQKDQSGEETLTLEQKDQSGEGTLTLEQEEPSNEDTPTLEQKEQKGEGTSTLEQKDQSGEETPSVQQDGQDTQAGPTRGFTGALGVDLYSSSSLDAPEHIILSEQGMELALQGYAPENPDWYIVNCEGKLYYALAADVSLEEPPKEQMKLEMAMLLFSAPAAPISALSGDGDTVLVTLVDAIDGSVLKSVWVSRSAVAQGTQVAKNMVETQIPEGYQVLSQDEWSKLDTLGTDEQAEYQIEIGYYISNVDVSTEIIYVNVSGTTSLATYQEKVSGFEGQRVTLNLSALVRQIPIGYRPAKMIAPDIILQKNGGHSTDPFLVDAQNEICAGDNYFNYHIDYYTVNGSTQEETVVRQEDVTGVKGLYGSAYPALSHYPSYTSGVSVLNRDLRSYAVENSTVTIALGLESNIRIKVLEPLQEGAFTIQYVDDQSGAVLDSQTITLSYRDGETLRLPCNDFRLNAPSSCYYLRQQPVMQGTDLCFPADPSVPVRVLVHQMYSYEGTIELVYTDVVTGQVVETENAKVAYQNLQSSEDVNSLFYPAQGDIYLQAGSAYPQDNHFDVRETIMGYTSISRWARVPLSTRSLVVWVTKSDPNDADVVQVEPSSITLGSEA